MFPPEQVEPGRLRALGATLANLGYTVPRVCERAGCSAIYDFRTLDRGRPVGTELNDSLDALIRLFMDGASVPRDVVEKLLTPGLVGELEAVELIRPGRKPQTLAAHALLYPAEGLLIASDLEYDPEAPDGRPDTVYPAITKNSQVHLISVPDTPCEDFLEICSGTGVAALRAARTCRHAWAVDITARSTAFARFNAHLNGLDNVTALQGDLYEPVAGLQFDRITAHPPYVPALEQRQIYRDGGMDGEQVTRRVFADVFPHLKPGGRLYCTCMLTDREGAPVEERVRGMLGEAAAECDIVVAVSRIDNPAEFMGKRVMEHALPFEDAEQFRRYFESIKVKHFVGATIIVERHPRPHAAVTVRRQQGRLAPIDVDGLLRWRAYPKDPASLRRLAGLRPRLAAGAHMEANPVVQDGQWVLQRVRVSVEGTLPVALETSPAATVLLAWCDGGKSLRELYDRLVAEGAAGPDAPFEGFAELVRLLLTAGVLEAEPLPA